MWASAQQPTSTVVPEQPLEQASSESDSAPDRTQQPDKHPLSGLQNFTLGSDGRPRTVLSPGVSLFESFDSNSQIATDSSTPSNITSFLGTLNLQQSRDNNEFSLAYQGGSSYYAGAGVVSGASQFNVLQQLGASDSLVFRRLMLHLADAENYSPESGFGEPSGLGSGISEIAAPNQSIYTGRSQRLSNTALSSLQYAFTPRSSLVLSATYGLLRYLDSNLLSENNTYITGGYDYRLNRHDSVGVNYSYAMYRTPALNSRFHTQSIQGSYGRKMTGRLALQSSAGAQFVSLNPATSLAQQSVYWTGRLGVLYRKERNNFGLSGSSDVANGAGVLEASRNESVQGSYTRTLSRNVQLNASTGWAHNRAPITIGNYNTMYFGFSWRRAVTPDTSIVLSYNLQLQDAGNAVCLATTCVGGLHRHVIGLNFNWQPHSIRIH
jgi:hypothetical protein